MEKPGFNGGHNFRMLHSCQYLVQLTFECHISKVKPIRNERLTDLSLRWTKVSMSAAAVSKEWGGCRDLMGVESPWFRRSSKITRHGLQPHSMSYVTGAS